MIEIILGALIIVFTSIGQVLLKIAADSNRLTFINLYVFGAYMIFFVTILISFQLLKTISMLNFTIIISLNYISVMVASIYFLNEGFSSKKLIGTLLVTLGIIIFVQ